MKGKGCTEMAEEILYTPEELAQKFKISKYTVYEMIKRGEIEAHHIGRNIRVSESQIENYLINSRRIENVFDGFIEYQDGEQYAVIRDVKISVSTPLDGKVKVSIKPEDIIISRGTFVSSARNVFLGRIQDLMYDERNAKLILDIGIPLIVLITKKSLNEMGLKIGEAAYAVFKTMSVRVTK